ncbi:hypothetical protein EON65_54230, partial [archaeon]
MLKLDNPGLSDKLVPALCKEACKNSDPNIKVQALLVMAQFSSKMDKKYIAGNILPSLKYITDNDRTPMVSMAVVGMYDSIAEAVGPDYIASDVLPSVLPLLVERTMNREQFKTVIILIKSLLKRIAEVRTKELAMEMMSFGEEEGG